VIADGLALMLGREPDIAVVGTANTAAEATRLALETRPDVILLDFLLPDGSGAEVARAVRAELADVAIIMLTARSDEETLLQSVEAGVSGFLSKANPSANVLDAIRKAADGEMLIAASTLAGLIGRLQERAQRRVDAARLSALLTDRERQVLRLAASGLDTRGIAEALKVGPATVHTHLQHLFEKLGAHSRLELIAHASASGLLDS